MVLSDGPDLDWEGAKKISLRPEVHETQSREHEKGGRGKKRSPRGALTHDAV